MKKSIKIIKPKANALLDFSLFLKTEDLAKHQTIGNALSDLIEKGSFPSPISRFFQLPKFKELVEKLKEGSLEKDSLSFQEIQAFQLLLESFHKLVHLDYDFEEIEHPVVQAKVLEQNIQDYLACADLFYPYEGMFINEILFDLFQSIQGFAQALKNTVLNHRAFFSHTLVSLVQSPVVALLTHLDRTNYKDFTINDWYPIATELHIDSKLGIKKQELKALAKGNSHTILNQLQTLLSDISAIYLKNPPIDIAMEIKTSILTALSEKPIEEKLSGQKVNELFYLEFWKEPYELLLTKESSVLTKLKPLSRQLLPLKESLYSLIEEYEFALPKMFSFYLKKVICPAEPMLAVLGKPNLLGAELSIGFHTTQYEYINDLLNIDNHKKISPTCKTRIDEILPILLSFLETYYFAKPLTSFHVIKNLLENSFSGSVAFEHYSIVEIKTRIEEIFSLFIPCEPPPFSLLEAGFNKLVQELHLLLNEVDKDSIEYKILHEKLFAFEHIDLPSYPQTWYVLGELLSVIFIYMSQVEDCFFGTIDLKLKNLFSYRFFQVLFHTEIDLKSP